MTYDYKCPGCGHRFDVIKSVKDIDVNETCPKCGEFAERSFLPERVHFTKTKVQHAEYNPGLGMVVKDARHRSEIAKRKGLVEVGNDYRTPENIHKETEAAREAKREAGYQQALKEAADVL